jgi:HEAT repeat protein
MQAKGFNQRCCKQYKIMERRTTMTINIHKLSGTRAVMLLALLFFLPNGRGLAQKKHVPVDSVIYDLKNPDPVRRKQAAMLLGENKVERATPDLVEAAGDSDPDVRREIIVALTKIRDIRALPAFVKLSSDSVKDIREKCLQGIVILYVPRESGLSATLNRVANFLNPWADAWADVIISPEIKVDPSATEALRNRLQDSDEEIRAKTAQALGILRANDSVPAMLETLRQDRSDDVRFELIRSFRKIQDPSVAKDLMNYITYGDVKVRNEAVLTVGRLRYRAAVPELTSLYKKEIGLPAKSIDKTYRTLVLDALAFIGDPESKDLFLQEKQDSDEVLRLHAVEGLARIGDPAMATDLSRDRLREKNSKLTTAQAYALYRMGRKEYLSEVVKASGSRKTKDEAKQYLVELKPEELPDLFAETKIKDVGARESLAEILGTIGDRRAIASLQELGQDRRGNISALANQAIRSINARADTK